MDKTDRKIALFIDSENVSPKYMEAVMNEIPKYGGTLVISRFYGDKTISNQDWIDVALKYSFKPMQQYVVASKKNAADMAMAIDCLEVMYQGKADTFFLVTSDSDFTPLAAKLREYGKAVIGIGKEKQVTPAFRASCNEFKYFEYLVEEENTVLPSVKEANKDLAEITEIIKGIIVEDGPDNSILLSILGDTLIKRYSDFDPRKYGSKSLSDLVKNLDGLDLQTNSKQVMYVRLITSFTHEDVEEEIKKIIKKQGDSTDLNKIKTELEKNLKGFDYRTFGYSRFSAFLQSFKSLKVSANKAGLK